MVSRVPLTGRLTCRIASELVCLLVLAGGLSMLALQSVGVEWTAVVAIASGAYGAYVNHEASRRLLGELRARPAV
jgi:hypothetical protein